ncbi:putative chitinase [Paraburkholderia terricola]|uniref:trypsin-like peptidase domain-containing protein n=1 Tax=Paraburkholderia terricola TaxID=169427 RepID=UPI00285FBDEB|nr:trypsin-like serine protease [Paraburkholderia terricola]MDR6495630.1 putative chitinase [Paraburkholderia terricola]
MLATKIMATFLLLITSTVTLSANDPSKNFISANSIFLVSSRANPTLVQQFVSSMKLMEDAGINSRIRVLHFLTQVFTETGGMRRLDESFDYTATQLVAVFGKRVTPTVAASLVGDQRKIANYIYGDRLGNKGRNTDDGWRFRGSGFLQVTGRYNFSMRAKETGLPIESNPDLAREPQGGLQIALAYWASNDINSIADTNDLYKVRVAVNGKNALGLEQAKLWYRYLDKMLGGTGTESGSAQSLENYRLQPDAAKGILRELGFGGPSFESSSDPDVSAVALKEFQISRSLKPTGVVDDDTLYALTDKKEWRPVTESVDNGTPDLLSGVSHNISTGKDVVFAIGDRAAISDVSAKQGTGAVGAPLSIPVVVFESGVSIKKVYAPYEIPKLQLPIATTTFVPFSVIEPDTRTRVQDSAVYPYDTVVQITYTKHNGDDIYACTGTVVSPNVVITAGHCAVEEGDDSAWHENIKVYAGRKGNIAPFGECHGVELFTLKGWVNKQELDDRRLYDLAAIKLDCEVGNLTGWPALSYSVSGKSGSELTIRGYPCDKKTFTQWESKGTLSETMPLKLFYDNDTYECMSGAPVLEDGKLVAVHTNGLHGSEPWASHNAGTRISPGALNALTKWMGQTHDH